MPAFGPTHRDACPGSWPLGGHARAVPWVAGLGYVDGPEPTLSSEVLAAAWHLGPWGWALVWACGFAAIALVRWRRGRRRPRRRTTSVRVRALFVSAVAILVLSLGVLSDGVLRRVVPEPGRVRGAGVRPLRPPPAGTTAVYAWGASTMAGDVYHPALHPAKVAAWCLRGQLKGQRLYLRNLARPDVALTREGAGQLLEVLADPATYRPAVVLVSIGHNELANATPRPGEPFAALRQRVTLAFAQRLRAIAVAARRAEAVLVIAVPAANLYGSPPLRSAHGSSVSDADGQATEALLDTAWAADQAGDWPAALRATTAAVQRSPGFARAWWQHGRALVRVQRRAEGHRALDRAESLATASRRVGPALQAAVRQLCADRRAVCVDTPAVWRARFGRLDRGLFQDLVHPWAHGHAALGQALADAVAQALGEARPRRVDVADLPAPLRPRAEGGERALQLASSWLAVATELSGARDARFSRRFALAEAGALSADALAATAGGVPVRTPPAELAQSGDLVRLQRRVWLLQALIAVAGGDEGRARALVARAGGSASVATLVRGAAHRRQLQRLLQRGAP